MLHILCSNLRVAAISCEELGPDNFICLWDASGVENRVDSVGWEVDVADALDWSVGGRAHLTENKKSI